MKNKSKIALQFFFLIILSFFSSTQMLFSQTLFQKAYSNSGYAVNTGAFYANYSKSIEKINSNKFILIGYASGPVIDNAGVASIHCVDSLGNTLWSKGYGGTYSFFKVAKYTSNGNIVAAGKTTSSRSNGVGDAYIIKTDENGNLIWEKEFGSPSDGMSEEINNIAIDKDENIYCLVGGTNGTHILKLDKDGNLLWQKKYVPLVGSSVAFHSLVILSSAEMVITGYINDSSGNRLLVKLDKDGGFIWSKKYDGPYQQIFDGIIALPSGGFVAVGSYIQSLVKVKDDGMIDWAKISNSPEATNYGGIQLSPDENSIYTVGTSLIIPYGGGATLSKFNLQGKQLWEKEYGGCGEDGFRGIVFGDKSTLYLAGITRSYGSQTNVSTYLVRTDTSGYTSCYDDVATSSYSDLSLTAIAITLTSSDGGGIFDNHISAKLDLPLSDSLICSSLNPVGVKFQTSDTMICEGSCISFTDNSIIHRGIRPYFAGIKYKWRFPGATFSSGADTLQNPTNICYNTAGTYPVTLVLTMGCRQDSLVLPNYITVNLQNIPIVVTGNLNLCSGDTTILTASGASTYNWTPSIGLDNTTSSVVKASPDTTTIYTVTGSLGSCTGTQTATIDVNPKPIAAAGNDTTICVGQSVILNGKGGLTFTWSDGLTNGSSVKPDTPKNYVYTAQNGTCIATDTLKIQVNPSPIITLNNDFTLVLGTTSLLTATGGGIYNWSPTIGLSCSDCATPLAHPTTNTNYCVTVTTNGCPSTKCVNITVDMNCGELFVPNSFSPNGDGNNDVLTVKINPDCVAEYSLLIFDRWGEKIFETSKITESWDGKFNGKELDNATFVYYLKMKLLNVSSDIMKKGNVSIIK